MQQSTLTALFATAGRSTERQEASKGLDTTATAPPKADDPAAPSSAIDRKRPRDDPVPSPKATNIDASDYYLRFHSEYEAAVKGIEPPTATSMAKLFQEDVFDPYTAYAKVWPAAKAGVAEVVPYAAVVDTLADISATSSRLECVRLLTDLLRAVIARCPQDLVSVVYLVVNQQAPAHEGVELGIGDALLVKVVAECCGMTEARAKEEYKQSGDLAEVAQLRKQKQATLMQPRPLSARSVFQTFRDIAMMSGKDVMRRRADLIKRLLRDAQGPEVNLIVRALQQKMRIGLAESSALVSIGYAFALSFLGPKQCRKESLEDLQLALTVGSSGLTRAYYEVPSLEVVLRVVLEHGFMVLVPGTSVAERHRNELSIRPGLPVKPQLAHPTNGISTILNRLQGKRFTSEYKYDGERAQIHYKKGDGFHIFSRNSETHTGKYPDVIRILPQLFDADKVDSFIIDSEVVAVNPETGGLQAFQVLQHRGRKNIDEKDVTIPVCLFAFDLLFFNGEPLLSRTLEERRAVLWSNFTAVKDKMAFATHLDSDNVDDIQRFLEQSIADGCEGLMIKTLQEEATYTPAKRSHYWLKLKKDYMDGVTDTLDLVPIAAFYGKGKRTGVFGGFLLACYDPESDEYQSICKIGTGFQDEELEKLTQNLQPFTTHDKPRYYRAGDDPDVWLTESQVWEVKAADLSISPVHFAALGQVDSARGVALRFPRFIRVRDDKKPVDCTSAQQVADMYRAQSLAIQRDEADDGDGEGMD